MNIHRGDFTAFPEETPGDSARASTDSGSAEGSEKEYTHFPGIELGHQVCARTLGDKRLLLQAV